MQTKKEFELMFGLELKDKTVVTKGTMSLAKSRDVLALTRDDRFKQINKTKIETDADGNPTNPLDVFNFEALLLEAMAIFFPHVVEFTREDGEIYKPNAQDFRNMYQADMKLLNDLKGQMESEVDEERMKLTGKKPEKKDGDDKEDFQESGDR